MDEPPRRPLVFIGFMGAGKSRALRAAAASGMTALDADALLERELGSSIEDFFERHGEAEFRRREEALVMELLAEATHGEAIALGGGAILSDAVQGALEPHVVVWLDVDAETAWERVAGKRPLARDRSAFEERLAERAPIYERLADAIVPGRAAALERAMPALRELAGLSSGTKLLWAASASAEYPAYFGRGLLGFGFWPLEGRRFLITDTAVGGLYGSALEPHGGAIEVAPGEAAKSLSEAERVLRELTRLGATRTDHVAALGGGVVGDLAGFCASVYQRGIPFVQVPTTLVAQVDSAYGGKTGVDLPEGKNYIGSYHQPAAVLTDPATLDTLPAGELAAGFAEVLKTALIAGGSLWERVRTLEELDPRRLDDVIFACARTKLAVVAADERDSGGRQALNLGHTVGHAIESASGYSRYRHGEAVGLGLLAALRLSGADQLRAQALDFLARHGLPTSIDGPVELDAVLAAIERDKKRTAQGVGFVLCERPGEVVTGRLIAPDRVRDAVRELFAAG
ncbi:MAG TPA: bifunctional shikimate kinase/3-dehydroquinate synthase [Solirubrobacterales bacterium]|nr:bifunctional shikimate kinase/3-dehydroquinate synthase [Solirubrobacterales bacterium]